MFRNARGAALGAALAVVLSGCGKTPPLILEAEGVVRLNGRPLYQVEVRFIPLSDLGPEYVARATTDKEGRFKLKCNGQLGACAGENRVVITDADLPAHLKSEKAQAELARYLRSLGSRPPDKYKNLATSPLTVNVEEGKKEYPLDLTR